jgi:hypothetical protein
MKNRFAFVIVIAASLLAGAAHAATLTKKHSVTLDRPAMVGDSAIPAGTYKIEFLEGSETARFIQGTRTVAEVPYKVEPARSLNGGDEVHYVAGNSDHDRLFKIVFAGSKLAVEFPADVPVATNGPVAGAGAGSNQ